MTTRKRMRKNDLQFYKYIRSNMVGNIANKKTLYNEELVNALLLNLQSDLRKVSLDILMLLWFSEEEMIKNYIRECNTAAKVYECLSDKLSYLYVLRALRVLVEKEDINKCIPVYLEIVKNQSEEKLVKEEAFLFFYKNRPIISSLSINSFIRSKTGLRVLTQSIVTCEQRSVNLLVKQFKRVNLESKLLILEGIKKIIEESKNYLFFDKFVHLLVKILPYERNISLMLLAKLSDNNLEIQNKINSLNLLSKLCQMVNDEENASLYYCLYCITGISEENRKYICRSTVLPMVFHSFNTKTVSKLFDINFLTLIYLFRSLTRSVHFIKSDLLDYPILDACISALMSIDEIQEKKDVYELIENNSISTYNLTEQILNLISNITLEYGNYKSFFCQKKALKKTLSFLNIFPVNVLFLVKNLIYDSCLSTKEYFLMETDELFFNKVFEDHFRNPDVVEQTLNLIRNLFCESESEIILRRYPSLINLLFNYEEYIFSLKESVVEQYIYIFVNMAINKECRSMIVKNINFKILSKVANTRDLKVAVAWLISNLTWKDHEDYETNVEILLDKGVREWLDQCEGEDSLLNEKIRNAYENLCRIK
ncbi:hypothetical protein H312_01387 [Anncaliia algerae PRA339]|uniref:Uncharacterized protein n=1 Tax=Anncaliia algerae PRA339 TaxID=1288291 RepID=A0A059F248_9MICR|nr:hypothetical protein H312_01387 [Anncaliia algerae PRA339]